MNAQNSSTVKAGSLREIPAVQQSMTEAGKAKLAVARMLRKNPFLGMDLRFEQAGINPARIVVHKNRLFEDTAQIVLTQRSVALNYVYWDGQMIERGPTIEITGPQVKFCFSVMPLSGFSYRPFFSYMHNQRVAKDAERANLVMEKLADDIECNPDYYMVLHNGPR